MMKKAGKGFVTVCVYIVLWIVVGAIVWVVWEMIVPDIFAGAVAQRLIPEYLNIFQVFKLASLLSVFFLVISIISTVSLSGNEDNKDGTDRNP